MPTTNSYTLNREQLYILTLGDTSWVIKLLTYNLIYNLKVRIWPMIFYYKKYQLIQVK